MVCVHVKIIEWRIYWLSGLLSINKVIELPRVPFSGVVLEATLEDDPPVGVQSVLLLIEAHSSSLSQQLRYQLVTLPLARRHRHHINRLSIKRDSK